MLTRLFGVTLLFAGTPDLVSQEHEKAAKELDPKIQVWVDKLAQASEKPVEFDLSTTMNIEEMGISTEVSGHMVLADQTHMSGSFQAKIEMTMPQAMTQSVDVDFMGDGEFIWLDMAMNMAGSPTGEPFRQTMKMSFAAMEKTAGQSAISLGVPGMDFSRMNMAAQAEAMFANFFTDVQLVETANQGILTGNISEEFLNATPELNQLGMETFRYVIDGKTGYPVEFEMGHSKATVLKTSMSNIQFLDPEKIDL
ncbi:MAG: hypothetical protein MK213_04030, partial [Planctomycetes bacterium]|nr:hypothetical protein [Planctomycetota bacterium]